MKETKVPAYNRSFEWLIQNYDCKQIPFGLLNAEKTTKLALLNVIK